MASASLPKKSSARYVAASAIAEAAHHFPDVDPQSMDGASLDAREGRLALAIHRTVLQRWLTIEFLLNGYLRKPLHTMEPSLQGVLLTAGAQLLFMDRLPAHAVVDEAVKLARGMVRVGAAGLVNAVLRRISELTDSAVRGKLWMPATDRLPLEDGFVPLRDHCLPAFEPWSESSKPHELHDLEKYLSIATSHPLQVIRRWLKDYGPTKTVELAAMGLRMPPIVVAVEEGFSGEPLVEGEESPRWSNHEQPGFIVWEGGHAQLTPFLREHPARRVQDVTATHAVNATAALKPKLILDYCAGRGTKTRHLAAMHPNARIIATDTDDDRRGVLHGAFAHEMRVEVVNIHEVGNTIAKTKLNDGEGDAIVVATGVDLLLLDVPCTNTGVLARRPEARYRFNEGTLKSLVKLQKQIIDKSLPFLIPGGHVLYSTCSIDSSENQAQVQAMIEKHGCELIQETMTLPQGIGAAYRDGGYVALLRKPV